MVEHLIRNERVAGSNPAFGSMATMPRSPARPAQTSGDPPAAKNLLRIMLLLLSVTVTAILLAFSLNRQPVINSYEVLLTDAAGDSFRSGSAQSLDHLERVTQAFFEASSPDALLVVCRDPARVKPLMARHHRRHPLQPLDWQGLDWARPLREPGRTLFLTQSTCADREPMQLVIELSRRGFHADWESHVGYSEMEWPDFLAHRPTSPTLFRVFVTLLDPPSETTGSPGRLELVHPDHPSPLQASLSRNDALWTELGSQLAEGGWKKVPLTLRLCYEEDIQDPSTVRIVGIEGRGWLMLNQ